jgi:hypothetical protein
MKNLDNGFYGISCPNHPELIYTDFGTFKLLDSRLFNLFNKFSMELSVENEGGRLCPLSECGNHPTFTDTDYQLMKCMHCTYWSCDICFNNTTECTCNRIPFKYTTKEIVQETNKYKFSALLPISKNIKIMIVCGHNIEILTLDVTKLNWISDITYHIWAFWTQPSEYRVIFHGSVISLMRPLMESGVYHGSIIYLVPVGKFYDTPMIHEEIDFWYDRNRQKKHTEKIKKEPLVPSVPFKSCPSCKAPVSHSRNHGCHHIGIGVRGMRCCSYHWCYVCLGPWPCVKCPVMCNDYCGCLPCEDCKPGRPCPQCFGCQKCNSNFGQQFFF